MYCSFQKRELPNARASACLRAGRKPILGPDPQVEMIQKDLPLIEKHLDENVTLVALGKEWA